MEVILKLKKPNCLATSFAVAACLMMALPDVTNGQEGPGRRRIEERRKQEQTDRRREEAVPRKASTVDKKAYSGEVNAAARAQAKAAAERASIERAKAQAEAVSKQNISPSTHVSNASNVAPGNVPRKPSGTSGNAQGRSPGS